MGGVNHYVYIYFRLDGSPVYVGRGTGARYKTHMKPSKDTHLGRLIKKSGGELPVVIIASGLTLEKSCEMEKAFIKALGREIDGGPLINLSLGGDAGSIGVVHGEEFRKKRSIRAKEQWQTPGFKERREAALAPNRRGNKRPRSEEFKRAMSERLKGNKHTLGYRHSPETKAKMSKQRKGVPKMKAWKRAQLSFEGF